jgi:uncharacterized protein
MFKRIFERFARPIETLGEEHAQIKFALTDTNLEEGTFKGVASVFGSMVQAWMPTVIEPGAFTKTLKENGSRVKLLWQHDPCEPIGKPSVLLENSQGLQVDGKVSRTVRGNDCIILMRDGVIDELSIGFDPIKWEMVEDKETKQIVRHIKELRLWEISAVTFAADPMAKVYSIHSMSAAEKKKFTSAVGVVKTTLQKGMDHHQGCLDDEEKQTIEHYTKTMGFMKASMAATNRVMSMCGTDSEDDDDEEDVIEEEDSFEDFEDTFSFVPSLIETHTGKVLSAKNKKLLDEIVQSLTKLLASAEPPEPEPPAQGTFKSALTVNAERESQLRESQMEFARNQQLH